MLVKAQVFQSVFTDVKMLNNELCWNVKNIFLIEDFFFRLHLGELILL